MHSATLLPTAHRFEALDALRGFASLAIVLFHLHSYRGGYLAVDFFLVLSGFVLSHSFLYAATRKTRRQFIAQRIARLYPLHLFTLVLFIAATWFTQTKLPAYRDAPIPVLVQHLTLSHNIGLTPLGATYNYPSWSISVEFWIGVLFCLLARRTTDWRLLLLLGSAGLGIIGLYTGHLDTYRVNYGSVVNSGLLRGASSFLLGMVVYRIHRMHHMHRKTPIIRLGWNWLELGSLAAVAAVVALRSRHTSPTDFLAPYLFMVVVFVFAQESGRLSRLLIRCKQLGTISYSTYLNHIPVMMVVLHATHYTQQSSPMRWLIDGAYLLLLITFSALTYRFIEQPSGQLMRVAQRYLPKLVGR